MSGQICANINYVHACLPVCVHLSLVCPSLESNQAIFLHISSPCILASFFLRWIYVVESVVEAES